MYVSMVNINQVMCIHTTYILTHMQVSTHNCVHTIHTQTLHIYEYKNVCKHQHVYNQTDWYAHVNNICMNGNIYVAPHIYYAHITMYIFVQHIETQLYM